MRRSGDWGQHVLNLPMVRPPGSKYEYCNGLSHLLSVIINTTTKMKTREFAEKNLFTPLGISEIDWEKSPQGIDVGYGRMWLKPHDMAKIGWLYLNKGRWEKKQLVSSSWVEKSTRGHIEAKPAQQYGYQWWVDGDGNYSAIGSRGQYIMVAPEMNMVVVFTGGSRAYRTDIKWTYYDYIKLTSLVVSSYRDKKCVYLVINTGRNPEKIASIVESLTFE